jgi:hypothetical protein
MVQIKYWREWEKGRDMRQRERNFLNKNGASHIIWDGFREKSWGRLATLLLTDKTLPNITCTGEKLSLGEW